MPVISFATSKGGAGKTTSCIILGTELAEGASVTIVDADPAQRLTKWASLASLPLGLDVVSSRGERAILGEIEEAATRSAFVLVDLEGTASRLTSFAMSASDLVIIPTGEEQQDADAAVETMAEVAMEARARRRSIAAVILLTRTAASVKSRLERHIGSELRSAGRVLHTELHRRTAYSSLHNAGGGLRSLDRSDVNGVDKAIDNASRFADEVITILEETHATSA